jgi:hypothetical protein
MAEKPSENPGSDLASPERRREIDRKAGLEPGELRKAIETFAQRVKPPRIEMARPPVLDANDIADSIARGKQAERDALSGIIDRHTAPVREAVNQLRSSHEKASAQMFWLTVAIVVLTVLLVVFGSVSTYLLLR